VPPSSKALCRGLLSFISDSESRLRTTAKQKKTTPGWVARAVWGWPRATEASSPLGAANNFSFGRSRRQVIARNENAPAMCDRG
jgi:hypothetical protein